MTLPLPPSGTVLPLWRMGVTGYNRTPLPRHPNLHTPPGCKRLHLGFSPSGVFGSLGRAKIQILGSTSWLSGARWWFGVRVFRHFGPGGGVSGVSKSKSR